VQSLYNRGLDGGESGIRTHGTLPGTRALQARALSRSAISPRGALTPAGSRPRAAGARPDELAEREGFEPSMGFTPYSLSRGAPSATRPPLRSVER
jgi:hypothetical protein